jgi:phosphate starvation-inducible PhoH-like protein
MSNKKKNRSKKNINRDMLEDYEMYKEVIEEKPNLSYYNSYDYLSNKDKTLFDNKFSKAKNLSQERYIRMLNKKPIKIIVSTGPAGTGKTLLATEYAVRQFLLGKYEKLIFTRPSVSVDEELGFLPGTLEEKMAPWIRPIYDILYNFISPNEVKELLEEKILEIAPLGYMRGRTFKNSCLIADEMQNSTIPQMKMLLTRIGENSKLIITGDLDQNDRPFETNGLEDFLNKFKGRRSDSISSVEFDKEDIEREDVVKEVLEIYGTLDVPVSYKDNLYETHLEDNNGIIEPNILLKEKNTICNIEHSMDKIDETDDFLTSSNPDDN